MGISQRYLLPVGIVVVFLLCGCGHNVESHAAALSSPTGVPAMSPTPSVMLLVGATSYQTGSTMSVTIKNQSPQTISFVDHRTNCTVLQLERQVANSWESVASCKRMIATRIHTLNAAATLEVKFIAPGQWPTGRYRARLEYYVGSTISTNTPTIVSSGEFRVS